MRAAAAPRGFCALTRAVAASRGCCALTRAAAAPCRCCALMRAAAAPALRLLRFFSRGGCFLFPTAAARSRARQLISFLPLLRAHARGGSPDQRLLRALRARRLHPTSGFCAFTRAAAAPFPAAAVRSRALRLHPTCGCCALTRAAAALLTPAENYLRPSSLSRVSLSGPHVWGNGITSHAFSLTPHTHSLTDTNDIRSLMRAAGGPRLRERRRGVPGPLKNQPGPQAMRARNETKVMLKKFIHSFSKKCVDWLKFFLC